MPENFKDSRFEEINEMFINYSVGNFSYRLPISDKLDEIDAFISSINMLGEELQDTIVSKNFFNNTFNSVSELLFVLTPRGRISNVNKAATDKLNVSKESLINKNIETVFNKKNLSFKALKQSLKHETSLEFETQIELGSKIIIPVFCSCNYLYTENEEKAGYIITAKDISNIKKYEASLKSSEEKYRKIFEETSDVIFVTDFDGMITNTNKAGKQLFNVKKKTGRVCIFDFFINLSSIRNFKNELGKSGSINNHHIKLQKQDSKIPTEIDCLISANKILGEKGEISGYHGIIKDISKQKETENLIIRAIVNTQENERIRFAKDLHDSLGQQLSAIKFYLGSLNSLNTIKNKKFQQLLVKSNELLGTVIGDLRNICFNLMPKTLENFGLTYAIKEFCTKNHFKNLLEFDLKISPEFPGLDKNLEFAIFRIVQEFINNSIKHGKANNIKIYLTDDKGKIYLNLRDNGKGFDTGKLESLSGMGLQNIQSRVHSYNGEILINSCIGSGTSYNIVLPII